MKRPRPGPTVAVLALVLVAGSPITAAAADVTVTAPDGATVAWTSWTTEHGPVAVVLWASWVPEAAATARGLTDLAATAGSRELGLVVVSVQEPFEDARRVLADIEVDWYHDRYGGLLKEYRVVRIPAMLIVTGDGRVVARLEPTAEALRGWTAE